MKIMHVTWGLAPGGTENLIVDVANEQVKSVSVSIMVINDNVAESLLRATNNKVDIFRINRKLKTKNVVDLLKIQATILRWRPDIIHLHHYGLYKYVQLAKLIGATTCLTVHSTNYPCVALNKHKRIFSISETVRRDLLKKCKVQSKTIYNGIKTESVRKKNDTRWLKDEPFRIVQVGRLQHQTKGQHLLLFALRKLIDNFQISNFTVDFIGAGESQDWLLGLMQKLQLQQHCNFLGELSQRTIYNKLSTYHLLVQPSLWEGFGLTMIEAMAAKVVVLASDIDAPLEVLQDGLYGYLFKRNDPDDLAQNLKNVIETYNQTRVKTVTQKASFYVENTFNVKNTATAYLTNYDHQ